MNSAAALATQENTGPRRGSLAWWVAKHQPPATVPVITRRRWLVLLQRWAETPGGRAVLKTAQIRVDTFLVVAKVIAGHCDGSTGRNIAVTNARLAPAAGRCEATVTRVRKVMLNNGFLYRSATGLSGGQRCHARPAIDHLTAPREFSVVADAANRARTPSRKSGARSQTKSVEAVVIPAESNPVDNLMRSVDDGVKMPTLSVVNPVGHKSLVTLVVGNQSARAWSTEPVNPGNSTPHVSPPLRSGRACRGARTPNKARPLKSGLERRRWWLSYAMADVLVRRARGFDASHRSSVASALYRSHLELEAWHAEGGGVTVLRALTVHAPITVGPDGRVYRWDWPDKIAAPGGFLAVRLRQLPARPETVPVPVAARSVLADLRLGPGSTAAGRAAAQQEWRAASARRAAAKRAAQGGGQVTA